VAVELGITSQTVFDYLARGDLAGYQLTKGQPWQSIYRTSRSIGSVLVCDAPSVPGRRHHESFGSQNTVSHSRKRGWWSNDIQGAPDPPGLGVFKAKTGTRFKAMIALWQRR
jgi:hypothetical protein